MNCFYTRFKQVLLKSFLLFTFVCITASISFSQADGGKLFKQNCARCHRTDDQKLTGPGLKDVVGRVPKPAEEWLHKWIKNNKEVIKSGDAYAAKIFNENGKQNMDVFDGVLSDDDINAIITYVKNPPVAKKEEVKSTSAEGSEKKESGVGLVYVLAIVSILLIVLVVVLGSVKKHLQDTLNAKNGLPATESLGVIHWLRHHKRIFALGILLSLIILVKLTYVGIMNIGVYESYQPIQPIKYSHQTHAGKLQINCVYCHSGAEKGRTAGIPSANVCMNCHKAISEGPKTGKVEIAKIYDAVGFDPAKGTYDESKQHPLKWVRVHNLPDFAYFNHSQHVVVGKQDCKNCHGDMATLDEAKQVSPLTMGWCIECHRKTEVPGMGTNKYYDDLHAKLKEKYKGEPITVEKIGGLDCIKCHY